MITSAEDLSINDPTFESIIYPEKKYLEVQVKDTGVGIKPEDQKKLFKLFGFLESGEQVNSKGIGLGLHISKKISKMFNGDIIC